MSLKTIQILEFVFIVLTIVGFSNHSLLHWGRWLAFSLALGLDTCRCLMVGEISTGPKYKWYGFRFNRDDSPEIFGFLVLFQIFLTLVVFGVFLLSL